MDVEVIRTVSDGGDVDTAYAQVPQATGVLADSEADRGRLFGPSAAKSDAWRFGVTSRCPAYTPASPIGGRWKVTASPSSKSPPGTPISPWCSAQTRQSSVDRPVVDIGTACSIAWEAAAVRKRARSAIVN